MRNRKGGRQGRPSSALSSISLARCFFSTHHASASASALPRNEEHALRRRRAERGSKESNPLFSIDPRKNITQCMTQFLDAFSFLPTRSAITHAQHAMYVR